MNKSQSIANLAAALAKAQAELPIIKFDKENTYMKYKYATLAQLMIMAVPVISKYGLSVAQFPVSEQGRVGVTSILMHETGEFIEETMTLVPDSQKGLTGNQNAGVSVTYIRRYAYAGILGLVSDEDTDGDGAANAKAEGEAVHGDIKTLMSKRNWKPEQSEAISIRALDKGLEPLSAEDADELLDMSALPEDAPVKTIQSWFEHYLNSAGATPLLKASDANTAYIEAKKKTKSGGK